MNWPSQSLRSVTALASDLPGVGLDEVLSEAALQTRIDRKYLLTPEQFDELGRRIGGSFSVLDIDGRRVFGYESVYFDTAALDLFRAHRQGRRRRYKARVRTYLDSGACMFEVKLKGRRGETVKHRRPYAVEDRHRLSEEAAEFLSRLLRQEYGESLPDLEPSVTTCYSRLTLVDLEGGARLTCDVDLVCSRGRENARGSDMILVESKSSGAGSTADAALRQMGVRTISISKYCIAVALLHRHLAANKWNRTLRTHFGWAREAAAA
jgi:VTC domain-containing protein